MLPCSVSIEVVKAIAGWIFQVIEIVRGVDHRQLYECAILDVGGSLRLRSPIQMRSVSLSANELIMSHS